MDFTNLTPFEQHKQGLSALYSLIYRVTTVRENVFHIMDGIPEFQTLPYLKNVDHPHLIQALEYVGDQLENMLGILDMELSCIVGESINSEE